MASTTLITSQEALLSQDKEALYEVVNDHRVELAPMGAYEARLASVGRRTSLGDFLLPRANLRLRIPNQCPHLDPHG